MWWPGKVLEVRLMFSEPILTTSGAICSCIIVPEVSVTIWIKCNFAGCTWSASMSRYIMAVCLQLRNTQAPLPCQQHVPYIMILPPDPCTERVREDRFMASWGSRAKLNVFLLCKMKCSVLRPTKLPVFISRASCVFFPDTNENEFFHFRHKGVVFSQALGMAKLPEKDRFLNRFES
ncbi:hypothetical protein TNCV_369621 [Trichonephila clavipes]|nr:hypothetical protein TNCV_369621 [Trichonephila clavipes]